MYSICLSYFSFFFFFFQAEDGIRDHCVTGVQTCALPIFARARPPGPGRCTRSPRPPPAGRAPVQWRSEEHTSELQSHSDLVCRLLLEKKKKKKKKKEENNKKVTT